MPAQQPFQAPGILPVYRADRVGKTQGAKVLADFLMGNTDQLIRFDMNEYIDYYAADRLVSNYQNPEGQLISKVRYQPFGILLLDEIEKAHRNVHDLLLQVLDDGRLTDGRGRTVDFSNTIIIMTSNLGAREASSRLGFQQNEADEAAIYEKEVRLFPSRVCQPDRPHCRVQSASAGLFWTLPGCRSKNCCNGMVLCAAQPWSTSTPKPWNG
ncbi:MAG: ATP-dependent Clp protease ATP-binding subunit [Saprospirales bacterium]|nr:ATP-dependent Clp protease ATP-binding subunit [Saprospirales bacterium]